MEHPKRFVCIGHRGARGHAPENTLLSIDTGIALGADMIEIDVQLCENELVVIHDPRLERTTNGAGRVDQSPLEYVRGLDAGQGQRVPTLEEVLALVADRVAINIEIKSAAGTALRVAAMLREVLAKGRAASQFLVSSFHLPELQEFKRAAPTVPIAVLLCGVPLDWAACAEELDAQALNVSAEFADARLVADAHARGLSVYAYTVNHPDDMKMFRTAGIDGIFTDYPDRLIAIR